MRQIKSVSFCLPLRPVGPARPGLLAAAALACGLLAGCTSAINPLVPPDLPANRNEVPEQAPNTNVIPEYGGKLMTEEEKKKQIEELEEAGKDHAKDTQAEIASRKY